MAAKWYRISAFLVLAIGFILAWTGGTGGLTKPFQFNWTYYNALWRGTINDFLFASCLALLVAAAFCFGVFLIRMSYVRGYPLLVDKFASDSCSPSKCIDEDIDIIANTAQSRFQNATSVEETKRLHSLDRNIFTIYRNSQGEFLGYTCVIRLTRKGVAALKRNEFSVKGIPREYVRQDRNYYGCDVYVGAIFCTRTFGNVKGFIEGSLHSQLVELETKAIYARAATPEGLRLLRRRKFSALHVGKEGIGDIFFLSRQT